MWTPTNIPKSFSVATVDGQKADEYPIIYGVSPSQVVQDFVHQQYDVDIEGVFFWVNHVVFCFLVMFSLAPAAKALTQH